MGWSEFVRPGFRCCRSRVCSSNAEDQGWELFEFSGSLGYDRKRNWITPQSSDYWCRFEDPAGESVFADQLDGVMPVTWETKGLRLAGWALIAAPAVAAMVIAGTTGLLKRQ